MKQRIITMLMGLFFGLCLMGQGTFHKQIRAYRVSDGKAIAFAKMIGEVGKADIILTGEIHDNERHHRLQFETIRGLSEAGLSTAIGLEMFPKESQSTLDRWVAGTVPLGDFI